MKRRLYKQAVYVYGENTQLNKAIEELNELAVAISHYQRDKEDIFSKMAVAEEIADVQIMIEQISIQLEIEEQIKKIKNLKLNRLQMRMREKKDLSENPLPIANKTNSTTQEKLRYYRKEANLSQAELGQKIGVSRDTVLRIEQGKHLVTIQYLEKVAKVLNLTLKELI